MNIIEVLEQKNYCFEELAEVFIELKELKNVEQNPVWHGEGNVFTHTSMVCDVLCKLNQWSSLSREKRTILFLAAMFHDIGKKVCTKTEDETIISPNHAVKGSRMFRELFYMKYSQEYEISFSMREEVVNLIRFHGLPLLYMEKEPMDHYMIKAREFTDFPLLYLLAKADLLGRICDDQEEKLAVIEYFKEYSTEIGCYNQQVSFYDDYSRFQYFQKNEGWYGDVIYDATEFTVYMMSGLPLSGKDTYIENHLSELPVISLDTIREKLKISPRDGSGKVVQTAKEQAKEYLRKGISFVWNATNITVDTRRKISSLCQAYGARVILIYIEVPYEELLNRNKTRERSIPIPVLNHMIRKLEVPKHTETYEVKYIIGES